MTGIYWGHFKKMLDDPTLQTEEVFPYHGISAELYDQMSPLMPLLNLFCIFGIVFYSLYNCSISL